MVTFLRGKSRIMANIPLLFLVNLLYGLQRQIEAFLVTLSMVRICKSNFYRSRRRVLSESCLFSGYVPRSMGLKFHN